MTDSTNRTVGSFWRSTPNAPGRVLPVALVLRLQRTIGNREVIRLLLARNAARPEPTPAVKAAPLPAWAYVFGAFAGALLGTAIAIMASASHAILFGAAAATALLGAGVAYLSDSGRRGVPGAEKLK